MTKSNRRLATVAISGSKQTFLNPYGTAEHEAALYQQDALKLHLFARNVSSPFSHNGLASSLLQDQIYTGQDIQIATGKPAWDPSDLLHLPLDQLATYYRNIRAYSKDDYVLANDGSNDLIVLDEKILWRVRDREVEYLTVGQGGMDCWCLSGKAIPSDHRQLRLARVIMETEGYT